MPADGFPAEQHRRGQRDNHDGKAGVEFHQQLKPCDGTERDAGREHRRSLRLALQ